MTNKMSRLLALLLVLAMLLPSVLTVVPVRAEEAVTELPTETLPADTESDAETTPVFYQNNFVEESQLADFDLYQSGTSKFVVADGVLKADGTDGEQKAILKQDGPIKSLSVNILPGESGVIYGGVYFGAKNAQAGQDQIQSQVILIKSDYTGWSDAPNRIDIVHGQFNNGWKSLSTKISETGNGNNLFSGGNKEALNLKLVFSQDVMLLTLSLVSNPDKYVQYIYEIEPAAMAGQVGIRSLGSDTCYDKLIVNEDYVPATLTEGLKLDGTGLDSYAKTVGNMTQKPVTIEAWVWVPKLAGGSRRQAIITNYTEPTVAKNAVGTWGLYTNEYTTLYYTERTSSGTFNHTLGVPVCNNSWNHVAVVRKQGTLDVYWNGEFVQTIAHAGMGDPTVVENPMTIGYCSVAAGTEALNSLKGQVGDIRLWSTERTEAQIQANMYAEMTGKEDGLIQHWNFDSQEKGIVSNTVEGGLDVELLGHTQIGNEEIRRWDFSQESQLEDFTFYYSTESKTVYEFQLKDGALYTPGSINNSSQDQKAMLNEQIDNITYIGADVTQGGTSTANTGFVFGVKGINSAELNDYEGFHLYLTRNRTSAARRPWAEAYFRKISNGTATELTARACNQTFFPGADEKLPFHIQVEFDGNDADALMYRLDDPAITIGQTYTFADGDLEGQTGLWLGRTSVYYDNFTIVSKAPVEEKPDTDTGVLYDNAGHSFHTESQAWKLTQELTSAPYTLEAWVKIPEGVEDSSYGYIVGNASRAPSVSMQMAPGGKLQLSYAVENADLSVTTNTYDVDTDLRNGKWTHVAYTMDVANDTVVAYINGVAVSTWSDAGLTAITIPDKIIPGNTFAIGSLEDNDDPVNKLLGWIADVRMWDRALSAAEVQSSMMTQYTTAKDGLMFNAPLNEKVNDTFADLSGNGYVVAAYDSALDLQTETHEPGSYSMIVIPDQQILSHYSPERLNALYQWIADNREKENIQIVMNVGDMADNCGNLDQWANTKAAVELLPDDLPFIAAPGNHDYDTNSGWNKGYGVRTQLTLMNEYLPRSLFESYPTEIGFFDETNSANQWQAFAVNGNHYLVMALEYVPQDDVIAWANEVVEAHPYHQVIVVTHSYVGSYGNLDVPKLWSNFLSKHENVIMAFSGHVWHTNVVRRTDKGENGNNVHQMLMDAQVSDTGSEGNKYAAMIGILRFNADGTQCEVSYYSTDRDMYDTGSNFTLTLSEPATIVAQAGQVLYSSVTEAIANANGEIVKILQDTNEAITINADVTIDLAGFQLSNVTVAEGASLMLVDSTADYAGTNGSATVTGTVERFTANGDDKYMVIGENGVYAPHKYYVGVTHVSLDTNVTGFGYKAGFYGDAAVQAQIANIGYELWLTEDRVVSRSMEKFQNVVTLRLKNFLVEAYGETPVNAKAIMTLTDGTKLESAVHSYHMRQMVELINESYAAYSVEQLKPTAQMIMRYDVMQTWEVANILASLKPSATVEPIAVIDQTMTVLGDNTSDEFTLIGAQTFTAQDTQETVALNPYKDWIADYYISMDQQAAEGLYLAGNYGSYGWIAIPVESGKTYTNVPVVQTLLGTSLTYEELVTDVVSFSCGVADTQLANLGATVTVELRLTNPEDPDAYIVMAESSAFLDSEISADYEIIRGSVTAQDKVITSAADTLALHKTVRMENGTYFAELNTTDNTRPAGIVFGANDQGTSYYLFRLGNGSKVELVKVTDGVETVVDTGYYPANRRKDVFSGLEIVVDGDTIHGYIHNPHYDRIHCFAVHTDSQMAGDRIGLWAANDGIVFRNSTVTGSTAIRKADVVIFGHSYTEMWTDYKSYFPEYPSLDNVGLGGSVAVQWEQFPEEIASYDPKLGIYLIGINDLTGSTTPKAVVASMEKTLLAIKELVPEFEVVVTAVNHCPNRATITAEISQCNALMRNLAASYDWIYYAETEYALCTDPSDPLSADASLFSDGLHPNAAGYAILVDAIRSAAKGENQPAFDDALAQEQLAEVKAGKMAYLSLYSQKAYTEENWVKAEPYYNAAVAKIDACTTELQVKNLDLSAEIAEMEKIPNKAADVIANLQNAETSDIRGTINWTGVDTYTVNASGFNYSLDNTTVYDDAELIFQLDNKSGDIGTAGLLLRATKTAGNGIAGYLVNVNTNGNYIQIYHLNNSYNTDGSTGAHTYLGGIVCNNYSITADETQWYVKIEGDTLYVNTLARQQQGESYMLSADLTKSGEFAVYESGHTGILSWVNSVSFDFALERYAGLGVEVEEEEEPDTNLADEVVANLLNPATRDERNASSWVKVDDYTVNANGYAYSLDNTAYYSDSEGVFKFSNNSGAVGVAGLLLRATSGTNKGVDGYLVNVNTNGNYIQIYYLDNSYNNDGTTANTTYIGGIVLNNYSLRVENTEFWFKIEGSKLYVNTVDRQLAGTAVMATIDLTKGGNFAVYEHGHTGVLSWVNGVSFDYQLKEYTGTVVDPNKAQQALANVMNPDTALTYGNATWNVLDNNTVQMTGCRYSLDSTRTFSDAKARFTLSNNTGHIGTGGVLLRASKGDNNGLSGYLVNYNINSNYIQIYYVENYYNTDNTEKQLVYLGGIVLNNYGISNVDTEFVVSIEGSKLYVNTTAREQAGTGNIVAVDLTKGGTYTVYESGYFGLLSWVSGVTFDLTISEFIAN